MDFVLRGQGLILLFFFGKFGPFFFSYLLSAHFMVTLSYLEGSYIEEKLIRLIFSKGASKTSLSDSKVLWLLTWHILMNVSTTLNAQLWNNTQGLRWEGWSSVHLMWSSCFINQMAIKHCAEKWVLTCGRPAVSALMCLFCSTDPSVVNISDEMAKTAVWKAVAMSSDSAKVLKPSAR